MIKKGSLVRYEGSGKGMVSGKLYSVHEVKDGAAWLWVDDNDGWHKRRVPLDEINLVVE